MIRLAIDASASPDDPAVTEAVRILRDGGIIAFPTETFYGLGVNARNAAAVDRIFRIKGRDFANPIALICADSADVTPLVQEVPATAQRLMEVFWPGPLTILFPAATTVLPRLTACTGKIGIRVSSHPVARILASGLNSPLTATSANRSGEPECTTEKEVTQALGNTVDAIITGPQTPGGHSSTVLDMTVSTPAVLREGAIPRAEILAVLGIVSS